MSGRNRTSPNWRIPLLAGAVAASTLLAAAIAAPSTTKDDAMPVVIVHVCLIVGIVMGVVIACSRLTARTKAIAIVGIAAGYLLVGAMVMLRGSPFPLFGVVLDQGFHVAMVERFRHSPALNDAIYKATPTYYPPLFFWVLGRYAAITGVAAYEATKQGMFGVALVVPIVALFLWHRVTQTWIAAAVVALLAVLAFQEWYEPFIWLAVVVFIPWWLWGVLGIGQAKQSAWGLGLAIVVGACLLAGYYYFLFIGVVHLALLAACRRPLRRFALPSLPRSWRHVGVVTAAAALLSAVYWLPYLWSTATTSGAEPMQNRFYTVASTGFPLRFLDFDPLGLVLLFGLAFLAITARSSVTSFALAGLLAAAYFWYAICYVAVLADTPLLSDKVPLLITSILLAAAGLGVISTVRAVQGNTWVRTHVTAGHVTVGIGLVAIIGLMTFGEQAIVGIPYVNEQRAYKAPTELLEVFSRATGARGTDSVVLTDQESLTEFMPVYVFNSWRAHYAAPAGLWSQRTTFLRRLAREPDPAVFAAALADNRYDHVDWLVLRRATNGTHTYTYADDGFPNGVKIRTLHFAAAQLDPRWFRISKEDSTWTVFQPKRAPALSRAERADLVQHFAGDLR